MFAIEIIDDNLEEDDETVTIRLSDPAGATLGNPSESELTILEDDSPLGGNPRCSLIFADGFESGDTSAWSRTVP